MGEHVSFGVEGCGGDDACLVDRSSHVTSSVQRLRRNEAIRIRHGLGSSTYVVGCGRGLTGSIRKGMEPTVGGIGGGSRDAAQGVDNRLKKMSAIVSISKPSRCPNAIGHRNQIASSIVLVFDSLAAWVDHGRDAIGPITFKVDPTSTCRLEAVRSDDHFVPNTIHQRRKLARFRVDHQGGTVSKFQFVGAAEGWVGRIVQTPRRIVQVIVPHFFQRKRIHQQLALYPRICDKCGHVVQYNPKERGPRLAVERKALLSAIRQRHKDSVAISKRDVSRKVGKSVRIDLQFDLGGCDIQRPAVAKVAGDIRIQGIVPTCQHDRYPRDRYGKVVET